MVRLSPEARNAFDYAPYGSSHIGGMGRSDIHRTVSMDKHGADRPVYSASEQDGSEGAQWVGSQSVGGRNGVFLNGGGVV